ncbi:MAG TPA: alpha/beta hydrolase [Burkholderiaceae bacterium]|nr:alpha/beta hydrolase [Burkholderiaceae bacterium]
MKLVVDGREAYAYTGGRPFDAALPTLVFVHGALNDHTVWTLLARWFAHHGWGVLAVDLPGHMRSAGPALTSVEAMADWLLALLDAAGVQRAALAGHSMGSLVALEAAARAPERATRLVMLGTAVPMPVSAMLLETSRDDPAKAIDMVVTWSFSTLAPKPSYPGPGVWLRGGGRALSHQVLAHQDDRLLLHTDFTACNGYASGLAAAARVQCPAHLILGAVDQMTPPRAARDIAAALKAPVQTVPGGHALAAECPEAVLAAMRKALA